MVLNIERIHDVMETGEVYIEKSRGPEMIPEENQRYRE